MGNERPDRPPGADALKTNRPSARRRKYKLAPDEAAALNVRVHYVVRDAFKLLAMQQHITQSELFVLAFEALREKIEREAAPR